MDYTPLINQVIKLWWLLPVVVLVTIAKSPWFKGVVGETLVKVSAKLRLPKEVYHPIHNVTLTTPDGTTQIDHVFVSIYGIFVVETKNMKGWIYGSEKQAQWTQKIYKQSYKFQNPLRQNYKHLKALEAALSIDPEHLHSVIAFVGDCTLKTDMPRNVTLGGKFISYIKSFSEPVFSEEQVQAMIQTIETGRLTPSFKVNREHVKHLKARSDVDSPVKCHKCGSDMILRTSKKGQNAGGQFWGCSMFPKCRAVKRFQS